MNEKINIQDAEVEEAYLRFKKEAEDNGYFLNNDLFFTKELIRGLLINIKRYGYQSCPCRLASGDKSKDLDIICPCDYRDDDLNDYGTCYCALYVTNEVLNGLKQLRSIPERRNMVKKKKESAAAESKTEEESKKNLLDLSYPVWRCKVCGYLCARDNPPEICPICKAKKERFEKFI
ncbi:MAG: ferredoxin:glutaredoxin reductase [Actinobacteria bacterium]|nr:ferredoxin:glutaredoxin reductase [Actinomycetota bacterium]MCL6088438.1 ferredoxin:glutaredoxin reductase [Actinomycetota bacterium]